jgi:hypothetical protein
MGDKVKELSEAELDAVMAAILQITSSKNLTEFEAKQPPTEEQWREAYAIAGMGWEDYEGPTVRQMGQCWKEDRDDAEALLTEH